MFSELDLENNSTREAPSGHYHCLCLFSICLCLCKTRMTLGAMMPGKSLVGSIKRSTSTPGQQGPARQDIFQVGACKQGQTYFGKIPRSCGKGKSSSRADVSKVATTTFGLSPASWLHFYLVISTCDPSQPNPTLTKNHGATSIYVIPGSVSLEK